MDKEFTPKTKKQKSKKIMLFLVLAIVLASLFVISTIVQSVQLTTLSTQKQSIERRIFDK